MGNRTAPNKNSHLWVLINILATFRGDPQPNLLLHCLRYAISASHLKIQMRFKYLRSKEYLDCFKGVKMEDIHIQASFERPKLKLELENDCNFLNILEDC